MAGYIEKRDFMRVMYRRLYLKQRNEYLLFWGLLSSEVAICSFILYASTWHKLERLLWKYHLELQGQVFYLLIFSAIGSRHFAVSDCVLYFYIFSITIVVFPANLLPNLWPDIATTACCFCYIFIIFIIDWLLRMQRRDVLKRIMFTIMWTFWLQVIRTSSVRWSVNFNFFV